MIVLFNKPFRVLCQFSGEGDKKTLKDYIDLPDVYPAGRLDYDSEGLVVLTDDGRMQARIADPKYGKWKEYLVQVEGSPDAEKLETLRKGVPLKDGWTRPARVALMSDLVVWERTPPIRQRKHIPTTWLRLSLQEGRNRQVRRMTASIGFPTLRLLRYQVGEWTLDGLAPGEYRCL